LPTLKIQIAHFAGGIARYLPRIRGLQQREKLGTASLPRHGRQPREPFDYYLCQRLFYDCAGWSGHGHAAKHGSEWVRLGLAELPIAQTVFATDYPQAAQDSQELADYVAAIRAIGNDARTILDGTNAQRLISNLRERVGGAQFLR